MGSNIKSREQLILELLDSAVDRVKDLEIELDMLKTLYLSSEDVSGIKTQMYDDNRMLNRCRV